MGANEAAERGRTELVRNQPAFLCLDGLCAISLRPLAFPSTFPARGNRASIGRDIGRSDGKEDAVQTERIVRLFRNGRNQALRIPRDLELPGNEALLRKEGNRLVVEPVRRPSLLELAASWEPLDEDFPEVEDLPPLDDVDL
jgi:antitoxin VapB